MTVETAVLLPVMMLLLMAVVQAGLWFHTRAVMQTAANRGVDATRIEHGTLADGHTATTDFLNHTSALQHETIDIHQDADTVTSTVSGRVVSLIFGAPLPITVTAQAPTEQVTP